MIVFWEEQQVFLTGGDITNVYNKGDINIFSSNQTIYSGGIAGLCDTNISNSYNIGNINKNNQSSNCYIGEILGRARDNSATFNSFYINNEPIGNNSSSNCVTTKVTSDELKSDKTLNLLNQDEVVWKKDTSNINNGYPIFVWQ